MGGILSGSVAGYAVPQFVDLLRYKQEDRLLDARWVFEIFHWLNPADPSFSSASNRNEYQRCSQLVKAAGA